jgi:hypothetical protein
VRTVLGAKLKHLPSNFAKRIFPETNSEFDSSQRELPTEPAPIIELLGAECYSVKRVISRPTRLVAGVQSSRLGPVARPDELLAFLCLEIGARNLNEEIDPTQCSRRNRKTPPIYTAGW